MGFVPFTVSKLASEGGDGCGVWCGPEGVFIGPGIALVERRIDGEGNEFAVVPVDHLNKVLSAGYGEPFDVTRYMLGLARVATALGKGDFALASIALVQLRLPSFPNSDGGQVAAIVDELLKARWDERWPAGAPPLADGTRPGGRFKPDDEDGGGENSDPDDDKPTQTPRSRPLTTRERMLIAARATIRQIRETLDDAATFLEILAHIKANLPQELSNDALRAAQDLPKPIDQLRASDMGLGFSSMPKFVSTFGSAGSGYDWHHIVEQSDSNTKKFGETEIHNTDNIVRVPTLVHQRISDYYSESDPDHDGYTRRSWLQTQSFDAQYDEGVKILREFGVLQ